MNWEGIEQQETTRKILEHWQKLGQFRKNHPSVGAGEHLMITASPYVFQRSYSKNEYHDSVIVGLELDKGKKELSVGAVFEDGEELTDAYSGSQIKVVNGKVQLDTPFTIVLLEN